MWFGVNGVLLDLAQCACVALPAAGVPAWVAARGGRAWALILPLSIVIVVGAITLVPDVAGALSWTALVLVPAGAALALGWAAHGGRSWLAPLAAPLLALAWLDQGSRAGQWATIALICGSCVALGRVLAGISPLLVLKLALIAMAIVDAVLVFGEQLQGPNAVLNAAAPAAELPQLQYAQLGGASLGYGDFLAAAVLGAVLAAERRRQLAWALVALVLSLAFDQLFLLFDTLPATVPPAVALLLSELGARRQRDDSAQE